MGTSLFTIDPNTKVGVVSLTVSNIERAEEFYVRIVGLRPLQRLGDSLTLGASDETPLLELVESPGAKHHPHTTGLFHFALLVPNRVDLARWLRHFSGSGYPLQGASDHLVSEALYLADPDGNGIEVYRDRPREEWIFDDKQVRMATDPLDLRGLLAEADDAMWTGVAAETSMGHIHLQVSNVEEAVEFYRDVLGFDLTLRYGRSAAFLSAGGYHHHIGVNTWNSAGAGHAPSGSLGLRHFSVELPDAAALARIRDRLAELGAEIDENSIIRDPSGNAVRLVAGSLSSSKR